MISLDAVVVMFGQSVKLGIYAVALVDIPNAKSPIRFAHVELDIGVTVNFDYRTMKVEVQLSPKSFILDPNCYLTGGLASYYCFDATHADKSLVSSFVFTLGNETVGMKGARMIAECEGKILPEDPSQGHTFLANSGFLNNSSSSYRKQNEEWVVRAGSFSFVVGCKMSVEDAKYFDEEKNVVNSVSSKGPTIYVRPMHLKEAMAKSDMNIVMTQDGNARAIWGMTQEYKPVPAGLWARHDESQDPTKSNEGKSIHDLLDINSGSLKLMMGILMQGPPAKMSEDNLKTFNILAQGESPSSGEAVSRHRITRRRLESQ
ncbi:transcriptional activator srcap [Fusarium tjaetaba]|uniref:Transcriptional activator srcap n=1 Tax=Fusarium tjaetaba TaxID=1567544 RepID=A0A8H5S1I0_9HYPO|nr:transcriptional activator srcap [Fusarium tjaetaba]KAF5642412.1 transcriptional activator srcap [Fusarium tjaetaba]